MSNRGARLTARQFYALIWKDFVVHKRHYIWTLLEIIIPVLVCAMAILSNSHQGKPKLENERTFDQDDYERLYGDLNPARHKVLVAPNSSFTRALVDQIDDGALQIELVNSEAELVELIKKEIPVSLDQVKRLLPDDSQNVTIGGVYISSDELAVTQAGNVNETTIGKESKRRKQQAISDNISNNSNNNNNINSNRNKYFEVVSKLDNRTMRIPVELHMSIRAKDFRLGSSAFPKKYSLGPFLHADHYQATFFMASQVMFSRAYINLIARHIDINPNNSRSSNRQVDIMLPTNDDLVGQRMPYPKFVAHKRLKDTTLGTFVAGSQKQKPFVLTMDYCITIGFLVTAIFLAKRIVDERKSRVRDMLRLVGISDWTYYGSHIVNTLIIMIVQCALITLLFTGHSEAPAQNIDSTLMMTILVVYCLSSLLFVLALSTMFRSSTKAIIFTSLLWLGLPEIIDRIFKMNAGVIESNGFLNVDESVHLIFTLLPNFGLRLMNRLLTECDIYGEFYAKKQLYGEYRAIWPNVNQVLPLYKSITILQIIMTMIVSIPIYGMIIYLVNTLSASTSVGLTALSTESPSSDGDSGSCCTRVLLNPLHKLFSLLGLILSSPFKLAHWLVVGNAYKADRRRHQAASNNGTSNGGNHWTAPNMNQSQPNIVLIDPVTGEKQKQQLQQQQQHQKFNLDDSTGGGHFNVAYTSSFDNLLLANNDKKATGSSLIQMTNYPAKTGLGENGTGAKMGVGDDTNHDHDEQSKYFERAPALLKKGVSIKRLCKTYYTSSSELHRIDAVRSVSLDMYYSQILVLLGHNGAGKTTLIDIISGHNQKTSGQVLIDGFDIDVNPKEARQRVGFCPQFDVLFERLTVQEHLKFYGIVKGGEGRQLRDEIEQLLAQSGLDVHRSKLSKALSGGYKRKLSLAIAMIANSKVLILDEPTSGMDPESRRKVWDFLQLIRRDRLILMTTHHMEEADALGDRIAVMSAGQVKCCGSALFLKKLFNAGYHLRVSKSSSWNQVAFDELISSRYDLQNKLENVTPHELVYKFDVDETTKILPALFDDLERAKERVGIFGFGITVSTMDDVFMKIGIHFNDVEAQEMQSKFEMANGLAASNEQANHHGKGQNHHVLPPVGGATAKQAMAVASPMFSAGRKQRLEGNELFRQHLRALWSKRCQHARKNWFQLLWILAISLACVASIVTLIDFVIFKEELTPEWSREMSLVGAGYGTETTGIYQFTQPSEEDSFESLRDAAFGNSDPGTASTTTTTTTTSTTTSTTPATTAITEALATTTTAPTEAPTPTPAGTSDGAETSGSTATIISENTPVALPTTVADATSTTTATATATTATEPSPTTTLASSESSATTSSTESPTRRRRRARRQSDLSWRELARRQVRADRSNDILLEGNQATNDSALFLDRYWLKEAKRSGMKHLITYTDVNTQMIDLLTRQFADFRERYIIGGEKAGRKYIAWYNGEATHSFPISMNIMLNSILKQFTDLIQDNGHPLKGSRINLKHVAMAQINTLIAFLPHLGRLINLVFLPFSLAFVTSYFVIFPTHERVTRSKHLQLMTGVPARTFWLSHFLFDLFLYSIYLILVLFLYFVWDRIINDRRIYFANFEHSVALLALVTLFIFGALPLAYIFSFLAKKPTSAFSSFCVLTIITGTATLTLVSLYELKYEYNATASFKLAFTIFLWTARLIPSVSLLVGLQKLFALNTTRAICINVSPEVLELLCRYINSPLVDDELRVLRPERCCRQVCEDECYDQWPFFWTGWFGINIELTMLVFDAFLYWFILVMIESRSIRERLVAGVSQYFSPLKAVNRLMTKTSNCWKVPQFCGSKQTPNENDKTLQIIQSGNTDQYSMVVNDLTKVYSAKNFKAVDGLSFVVDKREFFGLLGVNGAGKSTTFKMLTGELRPTSGNAWIGPYDVTSQRRQYLKQIGYCPQQDALIDSLSGYQMLTLFARLRGIPEHLIDDAVKDTLDRLGLKRIGHIDSNNYSGGNKRRLSVAMALIGTPEVVFLDEPTSGVDPRSRRRLWSTLIEFQQQTKSAIVMTSHSMNECECLCDRVAIMVGGQFKVLGSIQYLRTKLSQGFSLILKLKPDSLQNQRDLNETSEKIQSYMSKTFSSSQIQLRDLHQTTMQYHIQPSEGLSWSKMLLALEKAKNDLDLEDYQITSDASLESIFLALAKTQQQH